MLSGLRINAYVTAPIPPSVGILLMTNQIKSRGGLIYMGFPYKFISLPALTRAHLDVVQRRLALTPLTPWQSVRTTMSQARSAMAGREAEMSTF